jgi:hypothetical protein
MQELCYLKLKNTKDDKYQDIIVFLADGVVKGISSRISTNEIINVGQGGLLQSVVCVPMNITYSSHEIDFSYNDMQSQIEVPPKQ